MLHTSFVFVQFLIPLHPILSKGRVFYTLHITNKGELMAFFIMNKTRVFIVLI